MVRRQLDTYANTLQLATRKSHVLQVVTITCDFKRGGARKPIIGSSWNNVEKNHLELYKV